MTLANGNLYQEYVEAKREISLVAAVKVQLGLIGQINGLVRTQLEMLYQTVQEMKAQGLQQVPEADLVERIETLLTDSHQIARDMMIRIQTMSSL